MTDVLKYRDWVIELKVNSDGDITLVIYEPYTTVKVPDTTERSEWYDLAREEIDLILSYRP
jgi:hypothetical protein